MISMAQIPLAVPDVSNWGEGLVIFFALLAYSVPRLIKLWQERSERAGEAGDGRGEVPPGRRPGRRSPRGGGVFVDPNSAPGGGGKEALERWRDLLLGEEPAPPPQPRQVIRPAQRKAVRPEPQTSSPTLVELGESIEELHNALDLRHEQLEETHSSLPSESQASEFMSPALAQIPAEDELESIASRELAAGRGSALTEVPRTAAKKPQHRAWRRAVVLSEVFAPPIALRSPSEISGRMPG